jgi:ABC-type siderophore export system fused ATPase/permease subunit
VRKHVQNALSSMVEMMPDLEKAPFAYSKLETLAEAHESLSATEAGQHSMQRIEPASPKEDLA